MPVKDVVADFSRLGTIPDAAEDALDAYFNELRKKEAVAEFWRTAKNNLWHCPNDEINCQLRACGVAKEYCTEPLVGVAGPEEILKLSRAVGRGRPSSLIDAPAIVFPYETLPGLHSGFLLVQQKEPASPQPIFLPTAAPKKRLDPGYFMLTTALQKQHPQLRDTQFIVDDPFWALKHQCWQLARGLPLLPVMAAHYAKEFCTTGESLKLLHPAKRVFHGATHTAALISCACNGGGYVSTSNALESRAHKTNSTLHALAKIRKNATTWNTALATAITPMSEAAAYSFLLKLRIPADNVIAFARKTSGYFSDGFSERVIAATLDRRAAVRAPQDKFTIVEKNGKWCTAAGRPICDGIARITEVIYTDKNEKFYAGYAVAAGHKVEFIELATKIELCGLLEYVAKKFADRGVLLIYDRRWNLTAHVRVMQMHPPEIVTAPGSVGWSDAAQIFNLGTYNLTAAGDVCDTVAVPTLDVTHTFPEPLNPLPPTLHKFLTPAYENSITWAAFASFVSAAVAPVIAAAHESVAASGGNFTVAANMWRTLGATVFELPYAHANNVSVYVNEKTKMTTWPVCASSAFNDNTFSYVTLRCHSRPILIKMSAASLASAPSYGWHAIKSDHAATDTNLAVFRYVLPTYLQHILKNRLRHENNKSLILTVLRDLCQWLKTTTGETFNLAYAERSVYTPNTAHIALAQELGNAIAGGHIDVLPRPRRRDQPKNYILRQQSTWWINKFAVDAYFKTQKSVPPNWPNIVNLLENNGVHVAPETINNLSGYVIGKQWCDDNITGSATERSIASM